MWVTIVTNEGYKGVKSRLHVIENQRKRRDTIRTLNITLRAILLRKIFLTDTSGYRFEYCDPEAIITLHVKEKPLQFIAWFCT
jgi:hypothetical protein